MRDETTERELTLGESLGKHHEEKRKEENGEASLGGVGGSKRRKGET